MAMIIAVGCLMSRPGSYDAYLACMHSSRNRLLATLRLIVRNLGIVLQRIGLIARHRPRWFMKIVGEILEGPLVGFPSINGWMRRYLTQKRARVHGACDVIFGDDHGSHGVYAAEALSTNPNGYLFMAHFGRMVWPLICLGDALTLDL